MAISAPTIIADARNVMADAPAKPEGKSSFGFLGHKVFGKIPVWVIGAGAVGGYYWWTHYGPGKKAAGSQTATDPAGNTCSADALSGSQTGYCPGTPEDIAAGGQGAAGARGPAGPAGPAGAAGPAGEPGKPAPPDRDRDRDDRHRPRRRRRRRRRRVGWVGGAPPGPVAQPVPVAAPMTAGDIYGSGLTSSPDGTIYDSGYPSAAEVGGEYVAAG
jgi:hypothetical protein